MADKPNIRRQWLYLAFRTVISIQVVMVLAQAVFAGGFLSGHYGMLDMHKTTASGIALIALAQVAAGAFLLRPPARLRWPLLSSLTILVMVGGQIPLGMARVLMLHVPLAVIIISAVALTAVRAWQPARPGTQQLLGEGQ